MKKIILLAFIAIVVPFNAFSQEVKFTQDDRDRIIRLEVKLDEGLKSTNQRIDRLEASVQSQVDRLYSLFFWGFGVLFGGMGLLMGFIIWDRRTTVEPVAKRNSEILEVLREYGKNNPKLIEILKSHHLL